MDRDKIPSPVRRQLRQEAGFGCCRCGRPLGEYHHIIEYAVEAHNRPDDMMFLCLEHHKLVGTGMISEKEQRNWKAEPFNIQNQSAQGLLANRQQYVAVDVGDGVFIVADDFKLTIDGSDIISLRRNSGGYLDISINVFDRNGDLVCVIDNNEWIMDPASVWDVEYKWHEIIIRSAAYKVDFHLDARPTPMRLRGRMQIGERSIIFSDSGVRIESGKTASLGLKDLALVGINLEISQNNFAMDPRGNGAIVSQPSPRERLYHAKMALDRIRRQNMSPAVPVRAGAAP